MGWFRKKASTEVVAATTREALVDPGSRLAMEPKETPGYYPGFHVLEQQKFWDAATRKVVLERVEEVPPIRFFVPAEVVTMEAVVDRVLPQEDRVESTRIAILPGIDKRLFLNHIEGYRFDDMPSDQEAYRMAAAAIEAMAQELHGAPFHTLTTLEQETILQSLHDAEPLAAKAMWKRMNVKRFWAMLVSDCSAVYYSHPFAWDEIGFGGPAYPRGYMRLEGGEAEPWEVDEQRYEWSAPDDTISDRSEVEK
jgi:hypothetical protein